MTLDLAAVYPVQSDDARMDSTFQVISVQIRINSMFTPNQTQGTTTAAHDCVQARQTDTLVASSFCLTVVQMQQCRSYT